MTMPFALPQVRKVTFYKRDEITADLICCEVEIDGTDRVFSNHEEAASWAEWVDELSKLPGFDNGWHAKVVQPAFAPSLTIAYERPVEPAQLKD